MYCTHMHAIRRDGLCIVGDEWGLDHNEGSIGIGMDADVVMDVSIPTIHAGVQMEEKLCNRDKYSLKYLQAKIMPASTSRVPHVRGIFEPDISPPPFTQ
jgi:hypothetical protein